MEIYLYDAGFIGLMTAMTGLKCLFVSDLHGKPERYDILFTIIEKECPDGVFIGGDILPGDYGRSSDPNEFLEYLADRIRKVREVYHKTRFFVIMGNDDPMIHETKLKAMENEGLIDYVQQKYVGFSDFTVVGYSYVPPSPFLLKDWEKYDVSRFTGVGAVSPEEGIRTVEVPPEVTRYSTIEKDLKELVALSKSGETIYLFHAPPYETCLDRVGNDGKFIDHAPADLHVGSIAIRRFLEKEQPFLTLHGHIHESVRLTGRWVEAFGKSRAFGASHDGPGLALVRFDTGCIEKATREIIIL